MGLLATWHSPSFAIDAEIVFRSTRRVTPTGSENRSRLTIPACGRRFYILRGSKWLDAPLFWRILRHSQPFTVQEFWKGFCGGFNRQRQPGPLAKVSNSRERRLRDGRYCCCKRLRMQRTLPCGCGSYHFKPRRVSICATRL